MSMIQDLDQDPVDQDEQADLCDQNKRVMSKSNKIEMK